MNRIGAHEPLRHRQYKVCDEEMRKETTDLCDHELHPWHLLTRIASIFPLLMQCEQMFQLLPVPYTGQSTLGTMNMLLSPGSFSLNAKPSFDGLSGNVWLWILLGSFASNVEQVANLLCAQGNSALHTQLDWKWVVAYGLQGDGLLWLIGAVVYAALQVLYEQSFSIHLCILLYRCLPVLRALSITQHFPAIFGPGRRVPKSHSGWSCCCCYEFSKNPEGFLNTQRSAAKLCIHIRADIPHRSTVSDFPVIF